MEQILNKMDPEKRDRILNAAFAEFGRRGFEAASTNEIVEKAGISKGLLFHYFGNKRKLYETLCSFAVDYVMEVLEAGIDWNQRDPFLRVQQVAALKLSAMERYPHIYDFLKSAMENLSKEEIMGQFTQRMQELVERAYGENIDCSRFKPGVDIEKAMEILRWTVEGAAEKLLRQKDMTMEQVVRQHGEYMQLLRQLFYETGEERL